MKKVWSRLGRLKERKAADSSLVIGVIGCMAERDGVSLMRRMKHVDLIMIDISDDAWFDLDLANYQEQLVNGYTRMTPQAGLQIFMPDLDNIPRNKSNQNTRIEWLKNRNLPPPPEVTPKK